MGNRCLDCLPNKTKLFFDIERARQSAKQKAVEDEKTYAIYKEGNAVAYTAADIATERGYSVIEYVSKYL